MVLVGGAGETHRGIDRQIAADADGPQCCKNRDRRETRGSTGGESKDSRYE